MNTEITAIIVEDIKAFHIAIEKLVAEVAPDVKIVGNATSLAEAEILIKQLRPQLLFLDIQFELEGKTAFDLLSKFALTDGYNFQIIIITAHNEQKYYAEAFNFGALHFLTKPIDKQKLGDAIERVRKNDGNVESDQWYVQFQQFHTQWHSTKGLEKIIIEGLNYTEVILVSDIVFLEASGRYTYIYTNSILDKPICSSLNLGEYEKKLQAFPFFFRIHRNLMVNINFIIRFSKKEHSVILTSPFPKKYASKERFKEFIKHLDKMALGYFYSSSQ
jgi:two-component system, LytTR family, response regulator